MAQLKRTPRTKSVTPRASLVLEGTRQSTGLTQVRASARQSSQCASFGIAKEPSFGPGAQRDSRRAGPRQLPWQGRGEHCLPTLPLRELRSPRSQAPEIPVAMAGTWKQARVPADPLQLGFPCHLSLCIPWPELRSSRIPELCTGSTCKHILPLAWGNGGKPTQPLRETHLDISQKVICLLWAPIIPLLSLCPRETETCLLRTPAHTFK